MGQLGLFGGNDRETGDSARNVAPDATLADQYSRVRLLAQKLPFGIHFGTSSWTFPDWEGLVYPTGISERQLRDQGLGWYSQHPLLTTVGVDSSYYRPPTPKTLRKYGEQLPAGFPCVMKVFSGLVQFADPRSHVVNPQFLSPALFEAEVLRPLMDEFAEHVGCLVFEFPPMKPPNLLSPSEFALRLDRFFSSISTEVQYGVELRNPEFLCQDYAQVVRKHNLAHVFNFWDCMPSLQRQWNKMHRATSGPIVLRLMLPPGQKYSARKRELAPFNRVRDPQPVMRRHTLQIVKKAAESRRMALVIVNNKAEGCSPLSIEELALQLVTDGQ